MAALAWPSIRWTALTLAPALIASDAAVWRRSCAVTRGKVGSAAWHRATAPPSHDSPDDGGRQVAARGRRPQQTVAALARGGLGERVGDEPRNGDRAGLARIASGRRGPSAF